MPNAKRKAHQRLDYSHRHEPRRKANRRQSAAAIKARCVRVAELHHTGLHLKDEYTEHRSQTNAPMHMPHYDTKEAQIRDQLVHRAEPTG